MVKVKDTQHHRSPLIQGGLEIPIEVIVKMEYSLQNKDAMVKYDSIISHSYKEPVDGNFEDISDVILGQIANDRVVTVMVMIPRPRKNRKTFNF